MINFFRRIRQSLLSENKFSKYLIYAIGEIFLVVIGILIALQINNWNENRINRTKERAIISEIHQEFLKNKDQLAFIKTKPQSHLYYINKVVAQFPINSKTVNSDSVSHFMRMSFADWTFEPVQGRIEWLINSSNFDLVQNEELKDALLLWQPTFEDYHEDEQSALNFNEQSLYPYLRKNFSQTLNLKDERMKLQVLESLEYEHMMLSRKNRLRAILENDTNELQRLEELIDKIILLTNQK